MKNSECMVVWQIRDMNKPDSGDVVFHDHTISFSYSSHYVVGYYFTSVPAVIEKKLEWENTTLLLFKKFSSAIVLASRWSFIYL